jgi:Xaa-Pro aminopeptidase
MAPDSLVRPFEPGTWGGRQARLRALMERRRLPFLLVTKPVNIFYLTGFRGSAGAALFDGSNGVLWVDPRYTLQARGEAQGVEVLEARTAVLSAAGRWLRRHRAKVAGYDDLHVTCAERARLEQASGPSVAWRPAGGWVEELREIKDAGEKERLRQAGRLTARVFEELRGAIRPGAREADLAAEIEYRLRRRGAEGVAFETIVASGPRGALPHARASAKRLEAGELVIMDLGAILGGYAADMTRTVCLGRARGRARQLYQAVLEAQAEAVEAVRAGMPAEAVDSAARRSLERRGLEKDFRHSTGHGVGLEIHERPRLARGERKRLRADSAVTVEPGIYREGWGGIRIEDTVLVGADGAEILTPARKEDWIID